MNAKELAELWEPLAEREPGLRPRTCGGVLEPWRGNDGPYGPTYLGWCIAAPGKVIMDGPPADLVAALWRDAAVRWLAGRHYCLVWFFDRWMVSFSGDMAGEPLAFGEAPDRALATAVRAVLDAKVPA